MKRALSSVKLALAFQSPPHRFPSATEFEVIASAIILHIRLQLCETVTRYARSNTGRCVCASQILQDAKTHYYKSDKADNPRTVGP
jgi:hypothetical protein